MDNIEIVRGYATLHRKWKSGDSVQLTLDMPVQLVKANAKVEADKDRVALMRGPMVYCFEGADNGAAVQNLVVPPDTEFTPEYKSNVLGGVTVLTGTATALVSRWKKSGRADALQGHSHSVLRERESRNLSDAGVDGGKTGGRPATAAGLAG